MCNDICRIMIEYLVGDHGFYIIIILQTEGRNHYNIMIFKAIPRMKALMCKHIAHKSIAI